MLELFKKSWDSVPTVWIDVETTGVRAGHDRAVQVGIARFECGNLVDVFATLVNPGIPIPPEATAVHGITDEQVEEAPSIAEVFERDGIRKLLNGAQPGAYNAPFDRHFIPPFGDWTWPWLDSLSLVRSVDRFARGKGRHKLEAACERHGIGLLKAHDAGDDAAAAGKLFYKLGPGPFGNSFRLGDALRWLREREAESWYEFQSWLSKQPPREVAND